VNVLNGLDGKSALIGGALVLGGLVAVGGGLVPLLVVGGVVYLVGVKTGWWGGQRPTGLAPAPDQPPGVPPFFAEWHRQIHAADQRAGEQPATDPAPAPPWGTEVRVPVTVAPAAPVPPAAPVAAANPAAPVAPVGDDRRPEGESGAPPA